MGKKDIENAYRTGQGKVKVRSKTEIEETKRGRMQIVVTEIPFQVNKSRLIEKIAEMVKDKRIIMHLSIRDESSREGMGIVTSN